MSLFTEAKRRSLLDIVSRDVQLRRHGTLHVGRCPFHDDWEPSFVVYPDGYYHCFGCGAHGSVVDYVAARDGVSPVDAARLLVSGYEAEPWEERPPREVPPTPIPHDVLLYWHNRLNEYRRRYFLGRGFSDETVGDRLWGWTGQRYVIPIWEEEPGSVSYQAALRRPDDVSEPDAPKYLTLHKGSFLHGRWSLSRASDGGEVFVFFGVLTAEKAIEDGLPAVTPSHGVATWQDEWSEWFQQYNRVWVVQDGNESERDRTWAVAASIGGHAKVVVTPEPFDDYLDYRQAGHSVEDFLSILHGRDDGHVVV